MDRNRSTVVGVFDNRSDAERAADDLRAAGFSDTSIGIAVRDGDSAGTHADTGSNAAGGAATGAVVGGILGAAAALLIPGIGPVLAIGTLGGTVLAGAAAGAGLGALAGALIGMGVPEEEAEYYQGEFEAGRTIVTVRVDSPMQFEQARDVMRRYGAYDVENRRPVDSARGGTHEHMHGHAGGSEMHSHEHTHAAGQPEQHDHSHGAMAGQARTGQDAMAGQARMGENADTMKLREERLVADKERAQSGEVRLGKEVVEEKQRLDVPVAREEVVVERRPVNEPSDKPITGESRTIEVPVTEERANVGKETFVREEIGVDKRVTQDTQPVSGTVRREEARIEKSGDVNMRGQGSRFTWESEMPKFRQHWQTNFASKGRWDEYEPYYRYGFDRWNEGRWMNRGWNEVEPEFRRDWESRYPGKNWDVASNPIKHAWDHLTATPHTHTS
jgi:uncharacterized protein (TIGR02271 family)